MPLIQLDSAVNFVLFGGKKFQNQNRAVLFCMWQQNCKTENIHIVPGVFFYEAINIVNDSISEL